MTPPPVAAGARNSMRRVTAWAACADLAAVLVFVVIGRQSHHEGAALAGVAGTAWPFVSGLAAGWLALLLLRLGPLSYRAGGLAVACTVVLGMLLRHAVEGRGTPLSFLLVATGFLALFLLAWRALARLVRRRAAARG